MVNLLITALGNEKTYYIKKEIFQKCFKKNNSKKVYIIKSKENSEYNSILDIVSILDADSDFSFLEQEQNCEVYIDVDDTVFNRIILEICNFVKKARTSNNTITITFLDSSFHNLNDYHYAIFANVDKILIGECSDSNKTLIEELFGKEIKPLT